MEVSKTLLERIQEAEDELMELAKESADFRKDESANEAYTLRINEKNLEMKNLTHRFLGYLKPGHNGID